MPMEQQPSESWKKPIPDYANQEFVDIKKRVKVVDEKLIAGHSEEQRDAAFDTYHEVVKLEPSQEIEGLSVAEINTITEDLKKKMAAIERAKENVRKMMGQGAEVVEKLRSEVKEMKMMVFEESSVTEKTFSIEDGDDKETMVAKNKLRAVFEYIQGM